ncbi:MULTISPECIES: GcrA family cell cycle regulator [Acetobacter]|uniref:GcrA cell cycle regulator n=3 Tax=Acetobacter TaxID=434 RepID=F1YUL2_9PROT|nr:MULTISPECIES: GcrA family cell cycle regulator [Acetobacter]ANA12707.1 GcrA cell cycle regulator [Acetobacter oryzifermentans]ASL39099.1 GcrA cell cycle regulator [Acetobacter oryzifermentans]ATI12174.1 GcrA cell cycle regulator [Acetobacter pomorum]AXC25463.1 GcrA cell cycle regulator [Acetobacter sp. JWB]AXN01225.1 GcrA cell cycle regulator [Acetobacter pomorum]
MEWTEEIIAQLKALWAEGLSTAEIGRRLSITKNAVVGKAHRLGLPPRPSPIRRNAKPKTAEKAETPAAATPATAQTATPAQPVKQAEAAPVGETEKQTATPPTPARSTPPAATAAPVAEEKPAKKEKSAASSKSKPKAPLRSISDPEPQKRRGPSCCWPIGDPGTPGFHFCGATPIPGKPYCEEHAQIAYVRLRDRRDNVA